MKNRNASEEDKMKICILMGSPRQNGNTATICVPFREELDRLGVESVYIPVAEKQILPCRGCYACQNVSGVYGCPQKDDMAKIVEAVCASDCVVLATPIYIWYCTAQLKAVIDRFYGMNKYYGTGKGSLWERKPMALLVMQGYDTEYGAGPFELGMKHFCEHAGLRYFGMFSCRDIDGITDFQTEEAVSGAKQFARRLVALLKGETEDPYCV